MYEAIIATSVTAVTPFWEIPEGIYLVKRPSTYLLIEHYAVLVTGGLVTRLGIRSPNPIIIHQTYPSARVEWAEVTGVWNFLNETPREGITAALGRVAIAFGDPNYHLFANNCEQFARYIVFGEKSSTQLRGFAIVAGLVAGAWFFGRNDN